MSKDYTFRPDLSVTIGNSTKKSEYDRLTENTRELNQRLEGLGFIGGFLPKAGGMSITLDGSGRITQIGFTTSPVGTITIDYDDANGGRVNYVQLAMTDPDVETIRETFSYDGSNNITGSTRTVS